MESPFKLKHPVQAVIFSIFACSGQFEKAHAGPDACVPGSSAGTYVCEGDQSAGINVGVAAGDPPASASSVTVENLTPKKNILAPIEWTKDSASASNGVQTLDLMLGELVSLISPQLGIKLLLENSRFFSGANSEATISGPTISAANGRGIDLRRIGALGKKGGGKEQGGAGGAAGSVILNFAENPANVAKTTVDANGTGIRLSGVGGMGGTGGPNGSGQAEAGGGGGAGGSISASTASDVVVNSNVTGTLFQQGIGYGIVLEALGGQGGDGGLCGSQICGGGDGGVGGRGGNIFFNGNSDGAASDGGSWDITTKDGPAENTTAFNPHGLFLYSQGGMGGSAGGNGAQTGKGGNGGVGGSSGTVTSYTAAPVTVNTSAAGAHGVYGLSIAGQGGSGGAAITNPGEGGAGGIAAAVTLDGTWNITTTGTGSDGLVGSSIGGGAGVGGNKDFGGAGAGGSGAAGNSGAVTLTSEAGSKIMTSGVAGVGIGAQSIGGRAGAGGGTGGVVSFGANAGSAGAAGTVKIANHGTVTTSKSQSTGLLGQSIGGAGGAGGTSWGVFYSKGGSGSVGGNGNTVTISNSSTITTDGHDASGIMAQSIGGTGGSGGKSGGAYSVGGGAAEGGAGSTVTVTNTGTIMTGQNPGEQAAESAACPVGCSYGVLAQSIGGGGGNGGNSGGWVAVGGGAGKGGAGGIVNANNIGGTVETALNDSQGLLAQSIGGGGGNGGNAIGAGAGFAVAIGGTAGDGNFSSAVTAKHQQGAQITTHGPRSNGIQAQSIAGGGGNGGYAIAGSISAMVPQVSVSVGGGAGNGGTAGAVTVTTIDKDYTGETPNRVTTHGDDSSGILAQSIGGGGGNGGFSVAAGASIGEDTASINVGVGGGGGTGRAANTVDVESDATVTTNGDRSTGIMAQSLGGGGGNGGLAVAASGSLGGAGSVSVAVGGGGGTGSDGKKVTVNSTGTVTTSGEKSYGVLAQSLGGGGGNGGGAISGSLSVGSSSANVDLSFGGGSGSGGDGGEVMATLGNVTTSGTLSDAVVAQSVGGKGGNGGFSVSGSISLGGDSNNSLGLAIGGKGSKGGTGDDVMVTTTGDIAASGQLSDAIVAQSVGGSGGNGGFAVAGSIDFQSSDASSNAINLAFGGGGASGGDASTVEVTTAAGKSVKALGDGAVGIVAQSIGGGGGNGGMAVTGQFQNTKSSKAFSLTMGGGAGQGSAGNTVTIKNNSDVTVGTNKGSGAQQASSQQGGHGIVAQSIGGGGGNGGLAVSGSANKGSRSLNVTIGGGGGAGALGKDVSVTNTATLTTQGYQSDGILAQSIGGGGGNAGGSLNFSHPNGSDTDPKSISVAIGGSGAGGALGGEAKVDLSGAEAKVNAFGLGSKGVVVQSIGGGGGNGGSNHYYNNQKFASSDQARVGIGGSAGAGSNGGTASFMMSGGAVTTGRDVYSPDQDGTVFEGHGVFVQSIGGGGGNGGTGIWGDSTTSGKQGAATVGVGGSAGAASSGGLVEVGTQTTAITGSVTTNNYNSHAIMAQSVGGGGGNGGTGINGDVTNKNSIGLVVGIGGVGKGGGSGGAVVVNSGAKVTAHGTGSKGIVAQSIGGGGGSGGLGIDGNVTSSSEEDSKQIDFGLGNAGGGGGDGNTVTVINTGDISTGVNAATNTVASMDAIFVQSIGGGGGEGGIGIKGNVASTGKASNMELNVGVGLKGGDAGFGGKVSVTNSGVLTSAGNATRGILAQSIGGSGGTAQAGIGGNMSASDNDDATADKQLNVGVGTKAGGGGASGQVTVSNTAGITVSTLADKKAIANAVGIFAQSVGGGGGVGGAGVSGNVTGADKAKVATVGIGGAGGEGGSAFLGSADSVAQAGVGISNSGAINVSGDAARGIFAQSIGGGGGSGAVGVGGTVSAGDGTALTFGLGNSGGGAGFGGNVRVENSASINVGTMAETGDATKSNAHGIFAQSIGGGGGDGIVSGGLVYGDSTGDNVRGIGMSLGTTIADGGSGAAVVARNDGAVKTYYHASHGVFAQSIGGGGGAADSLGGIGTKDDQGTWLAQISLGGNSQTENARTGDGGEVTGQLSDTASVETFGAGSHGVVLQSIGGGGGIAGSAAGLNKPTGSGSSGTTANAKVAISLGSNGAAGNGGKVTLGCGGSNCAAQNAQGISPTSATISTSGIGILAQSIGGGGGVGGEGFQGASGEVNIGSLSSANSDAGVVGINYAGTLTTTGGQSHGILAQSIGGGGGFGGTQFFGGSGLRLGSGLNMGQSNESSGTGDTVTVDLSGSVKTDGFSAAGILAQSIGGGGGLRGQVGPITGSLIGSANGVGSAGTVTTVLSGATIQTSGGWAHGILAQSAGGRTGTAGTGAVTVTLENSTITTTGEGAAGIVAQSGGASAGTINVTIDAKSTVVGGADNQSGTGGTNTAVLIKDGTAGNTLTVEGSIASQNGASGTVVKYVGENVNNLTVDISGSKTGKVVRTNSIQSGQASMVQPDDPGLDIVVRETGKWTTADLSGYDVLTNYGALNLTGDQQVGYALGQGQILSKVGSTIQFDFMGGHQRPLIYDQLAGAALMQFDFGSKLELDFSPSFRLTTGDTFDLLLAEQLLFETDDLFDYIFTDSLKQEDWSIGIFGETGSFAEIPSLFEYESPELLRLTYNGPIEPVPLPGGFVLYGSIFCLGCARWARRRNKHDFILH